MVKLLVLVFSIVLSKGYYEKSLVQKLVFGIQISKDCVFTSLQEVTKLGSEIYLAMAPSGLGGVPASESGQPVERCGKVNGIRLRAQPSNIVCM